MSFEEGWAVMELLGHRTRVGKVSEVEIAGTPMLRIDIPVAGSADDFVTEFYSGSSVYSICPTDEEVIRAEHYHRHLPPRPMRYDSVERQDPAVKRLEHAIDGEDEDDDIPFEERSQDVHGTRYDNRDSIPAE